jgi:hypothetical protein
MAPRNDNLFQRLTHLFRSGPIVKRKIKAYKQGNASTANDVFKKTLSHVYSTAMSAYGTYDRMARYSDYSEMEYTPEIASALDIYAEESSSSDERGKTLHVYSENRQIKQILNDLFYDTLNVEFNLTPWVRDLVKYGDVFLFNDVSTQFGVQNVFTVPVNEIEREEGFDPADPLAVRFRWVTQGNQVLENWQITHMRLLGNDAFLPYGASVLESARRIWRQLILIEDAMLVYRVVRSPERRVFYIDVGNVPPEDVAGYMEQAKSILRSNQVVDQNTGRVDLRYNPLSVDEDYFIPIRGSETGTKIDTLAGGTNVTAIEDVEYIQKKLFSALNVPKAYLGYDEALSSKATLSQEDIRFSRKIHRIQKVVLSELNKLAIIHLYCHGFEGEDLLDFDLKLSNPSTIAQQQKLELFRMRFDIAAAAPEGVVDRYWIRKNIMNLTDDEIERIEQGRMEDKKIDQEIEASAVPGEEGGGGGGGGGFGGGGGGGGGIDDLDLDIGDEEAGAEGDEELDAGDEDEELDLDLSVQKTQGSLLSSLDEEDDAVISKSDSAPIKPDEAAWNRRRNHRRNVPIGATDSRKPDFLGMVGLKNNGANDPFKRDEMLGDPFKDGIDPITSFLSDGVRHHARLDGQLQSALNSLNKEIVKTGKASLISEAELSEDLLDLEIEEHDLPGDN